MSLYEKIKNQEENLSVIGLGYVGMPNAVAFADKGIKVIGLDLNKEKVELTVKQIVDLALIGNKSLNAEEIDEFIKRSNEIMMKLL